MTLPAGFRFAAMHAGIRKGPSEDLALMVSDPPASAAAVFTRNRVVAAPVTLSEAALRKSHGMCRAIVVNAGNANCATPTMHEAARRSARAAAAVLEAPREQILLASTGVIGEPLDGKRIADALPGLQKSLSPEGFEAASRAILTTDTVPKTAVREIALRRGAVRLAGMAKGAGMIHPNMATMLCFLFTDAAIRPPVLRRMLRDAVNRSFNCISVDGDTSTNDTVYLLANGASGVTIGPGERSRFEAALGEVAERLAVAIVRDGEGARKLAAIEVEGALSDKQALEIARAIANSPLVKTALAGADPNWGRILSAAGASGQHVDPAKAEISINGHLVCRRGFRAEFSEQEVQRSMEGPETAIRFRLRGGGKGKARFWTCDLTEEYIRINAEYRT